MAGHLDWAECELSCFLPCIQVRASSPLGLDLTLRLPNRLGFLVPCHPPTSFLSDPMIDNNRYCTLEFPVEVNTVLHGFAGYFETVLYRDISLSE